MNSQNLAYVLITSARNEELNIEKAIQSVITQTILPKKWVIVSDGSTDRTDDIVKGYLKENSWIEFMRMPEHKDRQFAAKAYCFNAASENVRGLDYDIIGNLDADISFEKDHFEFLISKFSEEPGLGVVGAPFMEDGKLYDYRFTNIEHVSGACQLFRRKCFEEIGGYVPIKNGGIDWVAVTTARMKGWKTRTFVERTCLHHRKMGTGNSSAMMTWFRQGRKDYLFGSSPIWEIFRTLYQMANKPYIVGGSFLLLGYVKAGLMREERPISKELVEFCRKEQITRLKRIFGDFRG